MKNLLVKIAAAALISLGVVAQAGAVDVKTYDDPYKMIEAVADQTFRRISNDQPVIQKDIEHLRVIVNEELVPYIDSRYAAGYVIGQSIKLNTVPKEDFNTFFFEAWQFEKDENLSKVFEKDEYISGKLMVDHSDKLWFFTKNYIHYYSSGKLSPELKKNSLPIPSSLTNSMPGYENILQLGDETYLIGTTDGYYVLKNNEFKFSNHKVSLFGISNNVINSKSTNISLTEKGTFNHDENNISFNYTVPEYDKYINAEYQYKLEGLHDEWSEWSFNSQVVFENLPAGDYVFSVRAKVANSVTDNIAIYSFVIKNPWYANNWAIMFYFILLIVLGYYIHKFYTIYHEKRHQRIIAENNILLELKELENEQQIMKIKNEQLTQDVDKKNKELAVSTMNLIKKTELLNIIKGDLKNSTDSTTNRSIKSVISTINKNVKEENTWNIFKEAFDSADNNFLKKVKENHPSLTPNDLRLCAYLRLNLSSKEIAPLLNISVRSIEIKRYRLRKKMNLPHEMGLVEYLLAI